MEDSSIHVSMSFQPCVVNFIEASGNIALKNPFCTGALVQYIVGLLNCICTGALFSEPLGVWVSVRFRDGVECL